MRKKKWVRMMCLVCLCLLALASCGKKKPQTTEDPEDSESLWADVVFPDRQFYIHRYGAAEETISIKYLYHGKQPKISLVGFDAPKAKEACTGVTQHVLDVPIYRGYRYEELQFSFDFSRLEEEETVAVNTITLMVDGNEKTVDTTGRLLLTRVAKEESDNILRDCSDLLMQPNQYIELGPDGYTLKLFVYKAFQDLVIDKIEICDWYQVEAESVGSTQNYVVIGDGSEEDPEESGNGKLPLSVSKGEEMHYIVGLKTEKGFSFSDYQTDLKLYYHTKQGKEGVFRQPIGSVRPEVYDPADEVAMWMDSVIAPSKDACEKTIFLEEYVFDELLLPDVEYYKGQKEMAREPVTGVMINFLFQEHLPDIRLMAINGKTPKAKDRIGHLERYRILEEYKGYQVGSLYIQMDFSDLAPGTKTEIETISLLVNGFEKTLDMRKNLVYYRSEDGGARAVYGSEDSHSMKNFQIFLLEAWDGAVLVKDLKLLGPFTAENLRINVDKETIGTSERVFPLRLEEGQTLEILADLGGCDRELYSRYWFSTVVHADVSEQDETGEVRTVEKTYSFTNIVGTYDPGRKTKKELEEFVDYALKRKKKEDHN